MTVTSATRPGLLWPRVIGRVRCRRRPPATGAGATLCLCYPSFRRLRARLLCSSNTTSFISNRRAPSTSVAACLPCPSLVCREKTRTRVPALALYVREVIRQGSRQGDATCATGGMGHAPRAGRPLMCRQFKRLSSKRRIEFSLRKRDLFHGSRDKPPPSPPLPPVAGAPLTLLLGPLLVQQVVSTVLSRRAPLVLLGPEELVLSSWTSRS